MKDGNSCGYDPYAEDKKALDQLKEENSNLYQGMDRDFLEHKVTVDAFETQEPLYLNGPNSDLHMNDEEKADFLGKIKRFSQFHDAAATADSPFITHFIRDYMGDSYQNWEDRMKKELLVGKADAHDRRNNNTAISATAGIVSVGLLGLGLNIMSVDEEKQYHSEVEQAYEKVVELEEEVDRASKNLEDREDVEAFTNLIQENNEKKDSIFQQHKVYSKDGLEDKIENSQSEEQRAKEYVGLLAGIASAGAGMIAGVGGTLAYQQNKRARRKKSLLEKIESIGGND